MNKGEQIDTAWKLGFQGDYSLIEEMIRPEYLCLDHRMGLEANFESEKVLMKTMLSIVTPGPCKILYENEEIVVTRWFSKYNETELRKKLYGNFWITIPAKVKTGTWKTMNE